MTNLRMFRHMTTLQNRSLLHEISFVLKNHKLLIDKRHKMYFKLIFDLVKAF